MELSCEPLDFCSGETSPYSFTSISTPPPLPLVHWLGLLPSCPPGPESRRGAKSSCVPGPATSCEFASVLAGRKRADDGLDEADTGLTRGRPLLAADEGLTYSRAVPEPPVLGLFSPLTALVSSWYVESVELGNRDTDPGLAARDSDSCYKRLPFIHTHNESSDRVRVCTSA